jgi:Asp-tRNA(Asn)/Glu-tRNA(Gln) amidotransferase A subunit family amidase
MDQTELCFTPAVELVRLVKTRQLSPLEVESVLLTYAITLLGVPAISIPAGWTVAGLRVGVQIIANRLDERTVLQAAAALERAAPWAQRRPAEVG